MKKVLKNSLLLFIMVALVGMFFMPASVKAAGVTYTFTGGVVTISGSGVANDNSMWKEKKEEVTKVVIGEGVTEIGNYMFDGCENLTSVSFPSTVTVIGEQAFDDCAALTGVALPKNLKELGYLAFSDCASITEIVIPKTLEKASTPFSGTKIDTVTFEAGLKKIPNFLMKEVTTLKTIKWNDDIEVIGEQVFDDCTSLTSVQLPKKLKELGYHAFNDCAGITEIVIPKTLEKASSPFVGTKIDTVTFEAGIKTIPNFLMKEVTTLRMVKWDANVEVIGEQVFDGCTALSYIELPAKLKELGYHAFGDCAGITSIVIPKTLEKASSPFVGTQIATATFKDGIKKVPNFIFKDCDTLKKVNWANSISEIGEQAFSDCDALEKITLPWYVKEISYAAFSHCKNLKSITIYQNVNKISDYAFDDCGNVTIAGKKGSYANTFAKKKGYSFNSKIKIPALKNIKYTKGNVVYQVVNDTINNKGTIMVVGLKKAASLVVIPDKVKLESYTYKVVKINSKAFYAEGKLKKISIKAKNIKTIGKKAFYGINKKAIIEVPKSKYSAYSKMLKKAGVTKKMKIKKK